jgi:hypothetical protein
VQDLPDNSEVATLREKQAADWFVHWFEGSSTLFLATKAPARR